jgi:uncharacterized protein YigA (DUF484 family)
MNSEAPYLASIVEKQAEQIVELARENERLRAQLGNASNVDEELIDCRTAAALLNMSEQGLRQLSREGEVPSARKVGGVWRYSKVALITWSR